MGVGDSGTVEKHLVELGLSGDLAKRPHHYAGLMHVEQEVGDALVFGLPGIRAGQQDGEIGLVGPGGPDLLAGDDPVVPVADRPGGERRQIGTRARLTEKLAPLFFVAHDGRKEAQSLFFAAVAEQRGGGVVEPQGIEPSEPQRRQYGFDRTGDVIGDAQPAVLGQPGRHDKAGLGEVSGTTRGIRTDCGRLSARRGRRRLPPATIRAPQS